VDTCTLRYNCARPSTRSVTSGWHVKALGTILATPSSVSIRVRLRHLGRDQALKRAGGWQHDTPLAQPVFGARHEFVGGPALDGTRAQPVAEIGRDVTIEVPDTEMTTDAQRLCPFRLWTARSIEEQNRRQAELRPSGRWGVRPLSETGGGPNVRPRHNPG
jgi:hypothetical protein